MIVKFIPTSSPAGKLADAEVHFDDGPLAGTKLVGFGVWETKGRGVGGRNVTFPSRQYAVNGERRSFALLRPRTDARETDRVRDFVLAAFTEFEAGQRAQHTCTDSPACAKRGCADCERSYGPGKDRS